MNTDPRSALPAEAQSDAAVSEELLPTQRRALLAGIGGLAAGALLVGARTAQAGPLTPPAGPVASTGKTLMEVEPRIAINSTNTPGSSATSSVFRITQPGSYYLTGNVISSIVNRHVIVVAASGVTIDLNGFLIRGLGTLQGAFDGIFAEAGVERVTVRNGHIELAGRTCLNLETAPGCCVEHVSASRGLLHGIRVGDVSVVGHCVAHQNTLEGITTGNGCTIADCTASLNGDSGIAAGQCSAITNCSALQNSRTGIDVFDGCTLTNCTAAFNVGVGIETGRSSTVAHCSALENGAIGIFAENGSTISDCAARRNAQEGIRCGSSGVVIGNATSQNGLSGDGAGIQVFGTTRVEGNNCAISPRGIRVTGTKNLIIRNTCTGNTIDYEIVANNRYGPIINITATGTAAVSGNSAADTSGTTHPWANFAY
jgi:hypothetical protein